MLKAIVGCGTKKSARRVKAAIAFARVERDLPFRGSSRTTCRYESICDSLRLISIRMNYLFILYNFNTYTLKYLLYAKCTQFVHKNMCLDPLLEAAAFAAAKDRDPRATSPKRRAH
jgi:hypothetical protein